MQVKSQKFAFWKLPVHKDHRGSLCAIEWHDLPFKPKRVYFIFDTKALRGGHAHVREKEVFVCLAGSFSARIHDGKRFRSFRMNRPGQALYAANFVWHEFDKFSKGAMMLAFSSTKFDGRKGYIMHFEEFLTICRKKSS